MPLRPSEPLKKQFWPRFPHLAQRYLRLAAPRFDRWLLAASFAPVVRAGCPLFSRAYVFHALKIPPRSLSGHTEAPSWSFGEICERQKQEKKRKPLSKGAFAFLRLRIDSEGTCAIN